VTRIANVKIPDATPINPGATKVSILGTSEDFEPCQWLTPTAVLMDALENWDPRIPKRPRNRSSSTLLQDPTEVTRLETARASKQRDL
jgi:hypothetical protein